ncbi:MAG: sigma 54-interacting transcriptional regulator [bacterium]|nr:sigma 54-interacting transcriptional regulator [bacterium]
MGHQNLQANSFLTQHHAEISDAWLKEVEENPRYKDALFTTDGEFSSHSQLFLDKLSATFENTNLPNLNAQALKPVITLWQEIRKHHRQHGLSAKDTALLIFSFKSTIVKALQNQYKSDEFELNEDVGKLSNLLDFLGILTYELYSDEQAAIMPEKSKTPSLPQHIERNHFIGNSRAMVPVFKAIQIVLDNDITILLEGESGTGKDVLANLIHNNSTRKPKPFITLNCGAIPKELIESELFGHEKGAFTGATETRPGKFEQAEGGTLFLDEIGELSLDLQVKLLRVLQNREIERVGGRKRIPVDVRIIAATNRNLKQAVEAKQFRLDLYYRLNVFPISIPPLRERSEDIVPLAQFFLEKYAKEFNHPTANLSQDAEVFLLKQPWEGNIRELENLMQRMTIIAGGKTITATLLAYLPGQNAAPLLAEPTQQKDTITPQSNHIPSLEEVEESAMRHALKVTAGNIRKAAEALGISRTTFYTKAEKYGISIKSIITVALTAALIIGTSTKGVAETKHRYPKEFAELNGYSVVFRYVYRSTNRAIVGIQTVGAIPGAKAKDPHFGELPATAQPLEASKHLGSGVIISSSGTIITSYNNIWEREQLEVVLYNGRTVPAKRIGVDPQSDLAVLKIVGNSHPFLTPAPESETIRLGDWVMGIGHSPDHGITIATGIISAIPNPTKRHGLLATNTLVPSSHSGGALVDLDGRLVGITSIASSPHMTKTPFSTAIPANTALRVARALEKYGVVKRGWIGVQAKPVPVSAQRQHKLKRQHGVMLNNVLKDSPADVAKLRRGDIILAVGNTEITSPAQFNTTIEELTIGKPTKLTVRRGQKTTLSISVNPADSPDTMALPIDAQITDALGLIVTEPDINTIPDETDYAVLVTSVEPDSPAARAGLKPGDFISELNDNAIISLNHYDTILDELEGSNTIPATIVRDNTPLLLKISL